MGVPAELISDRASILIGKNSNFVKKAGFLNVKQPS